MATSSTITTIREEIIGPEGFAPQEPLVLRLRAPVDRPRVTWGEGVVDNEHMGRAKSNCCCIYTPPRRWDDPSTWEPDEHETEHCRGHTLPDKPRKDNNEKDCDCDHC